MKADPAAAVPIDVACTEIAFRVASKGSIVNRDTKQFTALAFLRYRAKDPDGLSLFLGEADTCLKAKEEAVKVLNRVVAIGSLHAG